MGKFIGMFQSHFLYSKNIKETAPQLKTVVEARVAIRFMRIGRQHEPFYRVIAVDSRKRRDTKPLEFLGWYNPKTKEATLKAHSIKKWLACGAEASNTVSSLLQRATIVKSSQ